MPLLTNKDVSLIMRGRLYSSCVQSSMLHGSETWPVSSTPRNFSNKILSSGGGTAFLVREPFTQLSTSVPDFSSFESSSVTLQLSHSQLLVFNIYRPPSSSTYSKPFSVFLDDFSFFLRRFTAVYTHYPP